MKDEDGSKTDFKYFSGKTSPGGNVSLPPLRGGSRAPQRFQSSSTQLPSFNGLKGAPDYQRYPTTQMHLGTSGVK